MPEPTLQPAWLDAQGRKEGRYVIGPQLGHGAMGDVYEAWDIVLARPVALKILKHLEPAAMIRFMHEAQLHARLDLPNICRIYDVDATGGNPRIAMQLIRGTTLEDASSNLTLDEIVAILAQVADAVHGAHQLNLIHRDIKPGNILLQWREGAGWTPYLCDFGLAMALDGPTVTQPLALTGTPAYMAPEQVRGDRSLVGPPTDVYGLGSTLYFALVGRPPCVSTVTSEMLKVKRECRFPSPRSLEPEIPPELERILFKCMQPEPADRYASAAELAQALREFRAAPPAPAPAARGRGWLARNGRRLGLAAALAGLAGALLPLAGAYRQRQARRAGTAQALAVEAASLDQALTSERMLPVHDLRPAAATARTRLAALTEQAAVLAPATRGPLEFALARVAWLLPDLPAARARLEAAWTAGYRTSEAALARAQVELAILDGQRAQAAFLGQPAPAAPDGIETWLGQAMTETSQPPEYVQALQAVLAGDPTRAAEAARAALARNPWHLRSAVLASASLSRLAKGRLDAGDAEGAGVRYREALAVTRDALPRGQSDPRLHHAGCVAALGLAGLALDRGDLSPQAVADLERQAGQGLRLDPDDPEAQSDRLQAGAVKALRILGLGQDPGPAIDEALRIYWARTREPRTPALRADHMVLYWLQAERDFARNEDPGAALAEALKDVGHTADRPRDYLGNLLNLKLRVEAARGQDPRPEAEALLARLTPPAGQAVPAALRLTLARTWLTCAGWEVEHRIDAQDSLRQARVHLQRALEERPGCPAALDLDRLARTLAARARPSDPARAAAPPGNPVSGRLRVRPARGTANPLAPLAGGSSRAMLGGG
jgi:serine/threonine-protein kinase